MFRLLQAIMGGMIQTLEIFRSSKKGESEQVVFQCPVCQEIHVIPPREEVSYDKRGHPVEGTVKFACAACDLFFDADLFKADDEGVFRVRTWECPQCAHVNTNLTFQCRNCHYKLA